jgi:hypothetical protein
MPQAFPEIRFHSALSLGGHIATAEGLCDSREVAMSTVRDRLPSADELEVMENVMVDIEQFEEVLVQPLRQISEDIDTAARIDFELDQAGLPQECPPPVLSDAEVGRLFRSVIYARQQAKHLAETADEALHLLDELSYDNRQMSPAKRRRYSSNMAAWYRERVEGLQLVPHGAHALD